MTDILISESGNDAPHCCSSCWGQWAQRQDKFVFPSFIVCSECGNKRCPKATNHVNKCSGSNEPGQTGSRYE